MFYSDSAADFIDNAGGIFEILNQNKAFMIPFQLEHSEKTWTKSDAFILMNMDNPNATESVQFLSSFVCFKKTPESVRFVSEWLTYATVDTIYGNHITLDIELISNKDPRIITDQKDLLGTPRNSFQNHRHDQSIYSLLVKKWKLRGYGDPSQWGNPPEQNALRRGYGQVIYHHRNRE